MQGGRCPECGLTPDGPGRIVLIGDDGTPAEGFPDDPEEREAPLLEGHRQGQAQEEGTLEVSNQTGQAQIGEASGTGQARGGKGYSR